MKHFLSFVFITSLLLAGTAGCAPATPIATPVPPTATPIPATPTPSAQDAVARLHWFGTSGFLYNGSKIIYFDPVTLAGTLPPADLILITHAHLDHWSVVDIKKIIGPNTTLIISPNVSQAYEASKADLGIPAIILTEGKITEVNGVSIQAVPAYNTAHSRTAEGLGYIVTIDGLKLYMTGATDAYPEMAKYQCDIALVPISSKDKAQALAEIIPAKVFIFDHTSYYAAKAVADLFTQSLPEKIFVALQDGPNTH